MSKKISKIGVLTSGGDAPGMNAAIRAVVRAGLHNNLEVYGIKRGYAGLMEDDMEKMAMRSVSNIIQRGGTILKTARSEEFRTPEGRKKAAEILKKRGIDALVTIGGDGTFRGATALNREHGILVAGITGTIDNDVYGTDFTVGHDTAVNTALDAIDKIRDTAAAHDRVFFVEVMGRTVGFIALAVGVAGGAEEILIPETPTVIEETCERIKQGRERGKGSMIVVVAEGDDAGGAFDIAESVKKKIGGDYRVCVLGHVQRGGSPTANDRILASKSGVGAVEALIAGKTNMMVGVINGKIAYTPINETWEKKKEIDWELERIAKLIGK